MQSWHQKNSSFGSFFFEGCGGPDSILFIFNAFLIRISKASKIEIEYIHEGIMIVLSNFSSSIRCTVNIFQKLHSEQGKKKINKKDYICDE